MNLEPQPLFDQLIKELAKEIKKKPADLTEFFTQNTKKDRSVLEQGEKAKLFTAEQYYRSFAKVLKCEFHSELPLPDLELLQEFTNKIPLRFTKKFLFYPISQKDQKILFAVSQPWPTAHLEEAAQVLGAKDFSLAITTPEALLDAINLGYDRSGGSAEEAAEILEEDEELTGLLDLSDEAEDLLDSEDEEPIKKLMNSILFQSVKEGSSDVHIDPTPKATIVKNRVDGVLRQVAQVPRQGHIPLINRVKVMASLDISTKNQPQDGRSMVLLAGKKIDIRVSIIPTVQGERAVLRLLNQSQGILDLAKLGFSTEMDAKILKEINRPHGIVLVTGPTGSGKTTTLYSCLKMIDASKKNIVTIEDPVEYRISEYGQMQVNEKVGVTFAKGLRSMLRQDPDVIMVGEMRDPETAQIAIQAALTGHMVMSTLHTNDAPSSVVRLIDMGIEPFLVASTLSAILAQRLVRKVCKDCLEEYRLSEVEMDKLDLPKNIKEIITQKPLVRGLGCKTCIGSGYQGRIGVFELLVMSEKVHQSIAAAEDSIKIRNAALADGMRPMIEDAAYKVAAGLTTLEELLRVVYVDQSGS